MNGGGGRAIDDDDDGDLPLDPVAVARIMRERLAEVSSALARMRAGDDAARAALAAERDAARAERDAARAELARLRADRAWATVAGNGGEAGPSGGSSCGTAVSPALARWIADLQARCTYAEVCADQRAYAHALEVARLRMERERDAATHAVHVAACRREVEEARAAAAFAGDVAQRRAELAALVAETDAVRQTLAALRGDLRVAMGPGGVARMREAVRDAVRADLEAAVRADLARELAAVRARGAAEADRARAAAHAAHEALTRYRAEGERLVASLEVVARDKCASDVLRVRTELERLMLRPVTAAAASAAAAAQTRA